MSARAGAAAPAVSQPPPWFLVFIWIAVTIMVNIKKMFCSWSAWDVNNVQRGARGARASARAVTLACCEGCAAVINLKFHQFIDYDRLG